MINIGCSLVVRRLRITFFSPRTSMILLCTQSCGCNLHGFSKSIDRVDHSLLMNTFDLVIGNLLLSHFFVSLLIYCTCSICYHPVTLSSSFNAFSVFLRSLKYCSVTFSFCSPCKFCFFCPS